MQEMVGLETPVLMEGNAMAKASAGLTPAVEAGSKVGAQDGRPLIACTGKEEAAAGDGVLNTAGLPVQVEVEGSVIEDGFSADGGKISVVIVVTCVTATSILAMAGLATPTVAC